MSLRLPNPPEYIGRALSYYRPHDDARLLGIHSYVRPMIDAGVWGMLSGPYWLAAGDREAASWPLDFESGVNFSRVTQGNLDATPLCARTPHSLQIRARTHRFELRDGDVGRSADVANNRCELVNEQYLSTRGSDFWVSYQMMIEPGDPITGAFAIMGQMHQSPDAGDVSVEPVFSMTITEGRLRIVTRYDANPTQSVGTPPTQVRYDASDIVRGQWNAFVVRHRFDWNGAGELDVWRNGVKIVSLTGIQYGYNDQKGPYWQYGIYRQKAPETLTAVYANMEVSTASLIDRVANPLPLP